MSELEPIDSAPKDGVHFLGFVNERWIEGFYIDQGQLRYLSDGDKPPVGRLRPTHWMPLPDPPEAA